MSVRQTDRTAALYLVVWSTMCRTQRLDCPRYIVCSWGLSKKTATRIEKTSAWCSHTVNMSLYPVSLSVGHKKYSRVKKKPSTQCSHTEGSARAGIYEPACKTPRSIPRRAPACPCPLHGNVATPPKRSPCPYRLPRRRSGPYSPRVCDRGGGRGVGRGVVIGDTRTIERRRVLCTIARALS